MSISVIIPNWNAGELLRDAVMSINDDSLVSEIIVVDNASTDGSADCLLDLGLHKLQLIRNDSNFGAAKARHIGVEKSSNELISFLDADDLLSKNALSNSMTSLVEKNLDICILQMFSLFPDGSTSAFVPCLEGVISGQEAFQRTLAGWKIHPMGLMRRDLYKRAIESFRFHGHSDDELLTRHLFLAANRVGSVKDIYYYRANSKPITVEKAIGQASTELKVLALAISQRPAISESLIRKTRNSSIGWLFILWRQLLKEGKSMKVMSSMLRQVIDHRVSWRPSDWRHFMAFAAMCASVPVLSYRAS